MPTPFLLDIDNLGAPLRHCPERSLPLSDASMRAPKLGKSAVAGQVCHGRHTRFSEQFRPLGLDVPLANGWSQLLGFILLTHFSMKLVRLFRQPLRRRIGVCRAFPYFRGDNSPLQQMYRRAVAPA